MVSSGLSQVDRASALNVTVRLSHPREASGAAREFLTKCSEGEWVTMVALAMEILALAEALDSEGRRVLVLPESEIE